MMTRPEWYSLIKDDPQWQFVNGKLICQNADLGGEPFHQPSGLHKWVVRYVYAAQKHSRQARKVIEQLVDDLKPGEIGLNVGAGETRFHDQVLNLDIYCSDHIHIVTKGVLLPFKDSCLDLIISQEVLEHVEDPFAYISEIHRVLKPRGKFYLQLPFVIGYHPGPSDYWRFTRAAYCQMLPKDFWRINALEISIGHGSGFYRILVEFIAVTASVIHRRLYIPTKGLCSILFLPVQLFDLLTPFSSEKDRIPGGYFCIAEKRPT